MPAAAKVKEPADFHPLKDFDQWWFGRGSPVTLGLFRIFMSLVTFASLALTAFDFEAWYTEKGFLPQKAVAQWIPIPSEFHLGDLRVGLPGQSFPRINPLGHITADWMTAAFYIAVMVFALLTALGLWTRISSIALALGVISIHHRDPLILHSGDTLMRLCLMYLAVSPCGKACSLDRVIALWKGKAPPIPDLVSLWPQRLIQYQVALVYFTTVWWKWFGIYWKDGTATWYPANLHEFDRFPVPGLLEHQPFIAITTYMTIVTELSLATLVFYRPLRKWVLLAGIAMHGYIEYRFNIPFFAITIICTYLCFYEGDEISGWAKRMGKRLFRWRLLVQLPSDQTLRPDPALALRALDPFDLVTYDPGDGPEWKAMDTAGRKKNPFRGSWIRSIAAWPLGLIPGLWRKLLKSAL